MYMNMNIVMTMNMYIKPELELLLRNEKSMSGLVNKLLQDHYLIQTQKGANPMVLKNDRMPDIMTLEYRQPLEAKYPEQPNGAEFIEQPVGVDYKEQIVVPIED